MANTNGPEKLNKEGAESFRNAILRFNSDEFLRTCGEAVGNN